ncbi:histidine kinase dimerization/phosphoacceptor domain -containing protein [uncultured Erythrobacter sp.]|uniref:histidine kinase dimerization/phosphoacceptor domain -containing protein n=1 Tax=uncultured Erythrobacter sp. TaxID=263913 RepID=UPI0026311B3E|nr:histidine kinase dimerization/phosphoacceptor domain -containing protein [uncultured Erythrobacter sp.]
MLSLATPGHASNVVLADAKAFSGDLPPACSIRLKAAHTVEKGADRCKVALAALPQSMLHTIVDGDLKLARFYLPTNDIEDLARQVRGRRGEALRAAAIMLAARNDEAVDLREIAAAIRSATRTKNWLAMGYLAHAQFLLSQAKEEMKSLRELSDRTTLFTNHADMVGLQALVTFDRGEAAHLRRAYNSAKKDYTTAFEQFANLGDQFRTGMACHKLGLAAAYEANVSFVDLSRRAQSARGTPEEPCLLTALIARGPDEQIDYEKLLNLGMQQIEAAKRSGFIAIIPNGYNSRAINAKRAGQYAEAMSMYEEAQEGYLRIGEHAMAAATLINRAVVFTEIGDPDSAIPLIEQSIPIMRRYSPDRPDMVLKAQYQLGKAHAMANRHEVATDWFATAMETSADQPFRKFDGMIAGRFARSLYEVGDYDRAFLTGEMASEILLEHGTRADEPEAAALLAWLGARYVDNGRTDAARSALFRARELMKTDDNSQFYALDAPGDLYAKIDYAEAMAGIMSAIDRDDEAAQYALAALELNRRRLEETGLRAIANSEIQLALKEREASYTLMEQKSALTASELRASQLRAGLGAVTTALAIALAFLAFTAFRRQRKFAQQKDTFLAEIHHRTKNNLQLLTSLFNMDARRQADSADPKSNQREAANRARTMALLHDHIYSKPLGDTSEIALRPYIEKLIDLLTESLGRDGVLIESDLDEVSVDLSRLTPLGLLVNELVTNAFRHGFVNAGGQIDVTLRDRGEQIELTIADNGLGIDTSMMAKGGAGLGLTLVDDLEAQLEAEKSFDTGPNGTVWSFTIAKRSG